MSSPFSSQPRDETTPIEGPAETDETIAASTAATGVVVSQLADAPVTVSAGPAAEEEAEDKQQPSDAGELSHEAAIDECTDVQSGFNNARSMVEQLLGCRVRCTLTDGRVVCGRLVCVDRLKNLILADCLEERIIHSRDYNPDPTVAPLSKLATRTLAQAMVPGKRLVTVQVTRDTFRNATDRARHAASVVASALSSSSTSSPLSLSSS